VIGNVRNLPLGDLDLLSFKLETGQRSSADEWGIAVGGFKERRRAVHMSVVAAAARRTNLTGGGGIQKSRWRGRRGVGE